MYTPEIEMGDHGSAGELFEKNSLKEMRFKCRVVDQVVMERGMPLNQALSEFNVTPQQYYLYKLGESPETFIEVVKSISLIEWNEAIVMHIAESMLELILSHKHDTEVENILSLTKTYSEKLAHSH